MKFTRSIWITLFVVLVLVGAIVLGQMYNGANKDHKLAQQNLNTARLSQTALNKTKSNLATQLAQAVAVVAGWNDKVSLLRTQLEQANLSLTQAQGKFPASAQTIEYNEALMELAKSSNLTLQLVVATEPKKGDLSTSDFTFYTNVFTISVSGKINYILDFVDKVATSGAFKTGAITPITFNIPQPLSQDLKNQMREEIKNKMIHDKEASIQGEARVALIEQALLQLLGEMSTGPTVADMTQMIHDIIATQFNSSIADQISNEIALAIENNMANILIDKVATIYADAISALFNEENTVTLLPTFLGPLGDEIDAAILDATAPTIPGIIKTVITNRLNSMLSDSIAAMVSDDSIDATLAAKVTAAEMPTVQLTIGVYSYKGD